MLVVYDDGLTRHLAGVPHLDRPDRVRVVAETLDRYGMLDDRIDARAALEAELARVHPPAYIERVKLECERLSALEYTTLSTGDTTIDAGSYEGALRAAGGTLAGLERAVAERRAAFALVRPPGHHAEPARGMGFCMFNNAGIAARTFALETGCHALVADFDYHHGNGTEALVGDGVTYVSTHASPAYPGTGDPRENFVGRNGALANIPLAAAGIETEAFLAIWAHTLRTLAAQLSPGLLVVSAGYDFVAGDPVGDLGVAPAAARQLGRLAREIADEYCDGRALFVLEGGYDPPVLAQCVADTIAGYEEGTLTDPADQGAIPPFQRALLDALGAGGVQNA
jgi:acetoin utilization deacetylase AcuC-like enzyme